MQINSGFALDTASIAFPKLRPSAVRFHLCDHLGFLSLNGGLGITHRVTQNRPEPGVFFEATHSFIEGPWILSQDTQRSPVIVTGFGRII